MVKLTSEIITEFEPKLVHQIDVFRPEPRGMWPEVYKNGGTIRRDDFQRERMTRFGRRFPRLSNAARQLLGIHTRGYTADQA